MEKQEFTRLDIADRVKYANVINGLVPGGINQSGSGLTLDALAANVSNAVRYLFGVLIDSALSGEIVTINKVNVLGSEDTIISALPILAPPSSLGGLAREWLPNAEFDPLKPWVVLQAGENIDIYESVSGGITATVWYWDR